MIDNGVLLTKDGKIEAVGKQGEVEIPDGYEVTDVGEQWLIPGMVELHNHIASGALPFPADINDMVYLTNTGLRASPTVRPGNALNKRGVAGGVTTALYIPGSGTNMGGAGVLLKLGFDNYEEMEVRNPGSLKLAQSGNPESWTIRVGRALMNWNTRNTFLRGKRYHEQWEAHAAGKGPQPKKNIQWEIFRDLFSKKTQVSTHTQVFQVVQMTITMVRMELGLDVYIDHGSFDAYLLGGLAEEKGVPAILGPRAVSFDYPGFIDQDGKWIGMAAGYQERGHTNIGFNTDCVDNGRLPDHSASRGAARSRRRIGVRYGLDVDRTCENVRGLTIVPAKAARGSTIADRVGSLEVGKDADVVVIEGHPADPRNVVSLVLTNGKVVYDGEKNRLW